MKNKVPCRDQLYSTAFLSPGSKAMPAFTATALESLLEPGVRKTSRKTLSSQQDTNYRSNTSNNEFDAKKPLKSRHIFISPALYTTPEPAPIPDSSSASVSPSPYVVNHKRRNVRVPDYVNRLDGFEIRQKPGTDRVLGVVCRKMEHKLVHAMTDLSPIAPSVGTELEYVEEGVAGAHEVEEEAGPSNLLFIEAADHTEGGLFEAGSVKGLDSTDGFFDPRDTFSVASCSEFDDSRLATLKNTPLPGREFFDADEEFFSDGSVSNASPSLGLNIEVELRVARLNLFEEIEKRKRAEDTLIQMHNQWVRICERLSEAGVSFPVTWDPGNNMQFVINTAEQFCQEVVVARFVSEAIGRGQARAEIEAAAERVGELKNQEIFRLRDRLQYYEAVNHEMSHRNQEVMGIARRQRHRRKIQHRWVWSFIGLSITVGASVLTCSYFPQWSKHLPIISNDNFDVSSSMPEFG